MPHELATQDFPRSRDRCVQKPLVDFTPMFSHGRSSTQPPRGPRAGSRPSPSRRSSPRGPARERSDVRVPGKSLRGGRALVEEGR